MALFTVRHEWVVAKNYKIAADTADEAMAKLRSRVDRGEVDVWTDGYETTDTEHVFALGGKGGAV